MITEVTDETLDEIEDAINQIRPLMRGRDPFIQGAIIGAMMGTWMHGHRHGNREQTRKLREDIAQQTVEMARKWCGMLDERDAKS